MKYIFTIFFCLLFSVCFCQIRTNGNLKMFFSKQKVSSFSKAEFLSQKKLQTSIDTFEIVRCTVYFSYCGDNKKNVEQVMTTYIENDLTDSSFIKIFNSRNLPVCVTFDQATAISKKSKYLRNVDGFTIKVY